ncbi:MAG: sigma-70 family RNA polymerase sigma factor [Vicinamibacterales bacterium]
MARIAKDPTTSTSTDEQLVQSCLAGDQYSWDVLIARYRRLICSFPRKYGAAPQDVADVFQVVCAELFLGLSRLRQHDSVRAWVCKVAARQSYQWKRRHVIRAVRENALDLDFEVADGASPARQFLDTERDELVWKAMSKLTARHREVIRCLFFEEPPLPYDAVAKRLGVTPGSVSFLRARGLRNLEKILDQSSPR